MNTENSPATRVGPVAGAAIATGAGLLALTGVFSASGLLPADRWFGFAALAGALAALGLGLALHSLSPRPADAGAIAWAGRRRLTVLAAAAAGLAFAVGWVGLDDRGGLWRWCGLFAASFSVMAVYCAAMVHGCREDIHVWSTRWALPGLLAMALLAGALWLNALAVAFGAASPDIAMLVVAAVFLGFYIKRKYWRLNDLIAGIPPGPEIGKHRRTAFLCLFAAPIALTLIGMGKTPTLAVACTALAALSAAGGLIAERWLFVAEAAPQPPTPPESR